MDSEWSCYITHALALPQFPVRTHADTHEPSSKCTRGVPVFKWAGHVILENKTLVQFLVWSNPSNLFFASPALQADAYVVAATLASQFYHEEHPRVPVRCVL